MSNKALFLDRDGIVNLDHGYASKPDDIDFVEGIFELCRYFQQRGYLIIIVTNQSGIARGYYSEHAFSALMEWMTKQFAQQGVILTDTFYCPHHPEHGKGPYLRQCTCRKPQPGMLFDAAKKYDLDLATCVMVGDRLSDMEAARSAGVLNRFLVNQQQDSHDGCHKVTELKQIIPTVQRLLG
ncbi:D-glycero-beta-D-manno-heptose 1,7-bisphosphate 7-phosphatase [Aliiglaciecola litoralis]|uniref:D,D-heptose 1,7-bisphosphate phosphatase n=1 Tax=Aliiglaciecola litoralis TaxID=582857 RepID=A0ABN1LKP3_9ALTE